ncbi:HesB/YadR/YfhF family protein [Bacillus sp. 2205SS5-2]|uniref:HesB/YadR/YfhF family protein n=1 Tax=Bacillus sp. 2205SS5-2 TaxID=3109031 RepID=UPI003006168E
MDIYISTDAKKWFKREMELSDGDYIRFYVRYGGSSPLHEGFSLGLSKEEPLDLSVKKADDGVTYFIDEKDVWYFDGHDLYVEFNEELDEPRYEYKK